MRIGNVRIVVQTTLFALFTACIYLAAAPRIAGYPTSLFLELDPLVALTTSLSTLHLYQVDVTGLGLGVGLLVLTILLGRFFCGWICPFGALHHIAHWLGFPRGTKKRLDANHPRPSHRIKYWILGILVGSALLGVLQIGWLDPIALLSRSMTDVVFPLLDGGLRAVGLGGIHPSATPLFQGAVLIGLLFAAFLLLNLLQPRFFCRVLCPLGALLGLFSRFALFRIHRDRVRCDGCNLCSRGCEGAAEPEGTLRASECMVCMNCIEDCPEGAMRFRFLPPASDSVAHTSLGARRAVLAALGGVAVGWCLRNAGAAIPESGRRGAIRPPGSVPEEDFLARCIKCDACLGVCPTNVLQPAGLQTGLEGLWTPVMDFKLGYCDVTCTLCGRVCPTGAIQRLSPAQRQGHEARPDGDDGPIQIGTAAYDRGRCLPWAMDRQCVVCEEVCPVSPKAIYTREERVVDRAGQEKVLRRPYVDPDLCVGCGICEHHCPIRGPAAIRVGSPMQTL